MRNYGSKSFLEKKNQTNTKPVLEPSTRGQSASELCGGRRCSALNNWTPSSKTLQMVSASLGSVNLEIHEPWEVGFIIYFKREAFSELQIQAEDPYNKTKGVLHVYKFIFLFSTCPKKMLQL